MKQNKTLRLCTVVLALACLAGCGSAPAPANSASAASPAAQSTARVATSAEMATPTELDTEGLTPVYADALTDGEYTITVDSDSSMFNITACVLTVRQGTMTAAMTMGGTGYLYIYPGTGEQAAAADASGYIPFAENEDGTHTFTLPVEALDAAADCAAFSKKKEKWYDRTLVFRANSLPEEAFSAPRGTDVESLAPADGSYTAQVTLAGGSGRATVESPAQLTVENGTVTAKIVWGSSNYDYMVVDGEKYLPAQTEGNATFYIPVAAFDRDLTVAADTTAMSTPHEIEYTLRFDSASLAEQP